MTASNRHNLYVFDANRSVGIIGYDSREESFSFAYEPQWCAAKDAYPLSPSIPLTGPEPSSGTVRRFLENLLPEGKALEIVSTTHQISKNNIFGLVRQLGAETSGALSFLPEGVLPESRSTRLREIQPDELRQRIEARAQVPFAVWDGRVRMSLAGCQDKLAVYVHENRFYLVEGALASTHILKPEPLDSRLHGLVANEHFCMRLASRLGLKTAEVSIVRVPHAVLVVRRFDREVNNDAVKRIHLVDACQALDLPVSYKYERIFGSGKDVRHVRDGVSFESLFSKIVDYTTQKALTRQALVRWAIFQYLIGNADAHGKNVSFFCGSSGLAIAPFYDLVSVVQYPELDHELAMGYGDEFRLEDITPFAWADFAKRVGLQRSFLAREMTRMADSALKAVPEQVAEGDYVDEEQDLVLRISDFVAVQAQKLRLAAKSMTQVDSTLL
ncbi:MAG: HipA domain-containing protein [Sulfuricella sp.]|jgi:serine/threonine-protein kinase HipA